MENPIVMVTEPTMIKDEEPPKIESPAENSEISSPDETPAPENPMPGFLTPS
jgi:hypothetical protein